MSRHDLRHLVVIEALKVLKVLPINSVNFADVITAGYPKFRRGKGGIKGSGDYNTPAATGLRIPKP